MASKIPGVANFMFTNSFTSGMAKIVMGVAPQRSLPKLSKTTLKDYYEKNKTRLEPQDSIKSVYFFNDEFTNYLDAEIGIDALELLSKLNYNVIFVDHEESGRAHISKGFLEEAKEMANKNVAIFSELVSEDAPLIGLEPSAVLTFRDEYLRLADDRKKASDLSKNSFIIEEFLKKEIALGNISGAISS